MRQHRQRVAVIGAGIIGVCAANALLKDGYDVEMIDPVEPGTPGQCSYGNAGGIAPGACIPNATPGLVRNIPKWLLDPEGPVFIRLMHLPHALPWLLRFIMTSSEKRTREIGAAMRSLHRLSFDCYEPLLREAGCEDLLLKRGQLFVFEDPSGPEKSGFSLSMRRENGVKYEILSEAEVHDLEPALGPVIKRGIFLPEQGQCPNPGRLVASLARLAVGCGAVVTADKVTGFEFGASGPIAVRTEGGQRIAADHFVLAAGARSSALAKALGTRVPLESERGYHAMIHSAATGLRVQTISSERKFVAAPMEEGLRVSGVVEFAGLDAPPDPRRANVLVRQARAIFPGLDTFAVTPWMGHRPGTPDSIPVIERSRRHHNVVFAFGHGHQGMIAGSVTGRLVSELVAGRPTSIDLHPFRSSRF
jgi:D-amino-acid dehydrogenase